jgi:hypothetical protein
MESLQARSKVITLLEKYSEFLMVSGYLDTDWKDEPPYAIDVFLASTPNVLNDFINEPQED